MRFTVILTALFFMLQLVYGQKVAEKIHETKLPNGEVIEIMSDSTWRKKIVEKPEVEFVKIEGGKFMMGSSAEEPDRLDDELQHQVTLSSFQMSKHEITFDQYDRFCEATGREKPDDQGWGRGTRPVINVSWHDAVAFAEWMDARLPTEAEWEYAARAGTMTPFNTGTQLTSNQSNFNGTKPYNNGAAGEYRRMTLPVGSFESNKWGLYDMHGNVWEWCSDWYGPYPDSTLPNPQGPETGAAKVFRGGGWYSPGMMCRSARRYNLNPDFHYSFVGFRIVK